MGVKDNFSQAMSELIGISKEAAERVKETAQDAEGAAGPEDADTGPPQSVTEGQLDGALVAEKDEAAPPTVFQPPEPEPAIPEPSLSPPPRPEPGVTTIARGTVILGEINAEGDVELLGSVKGKIASQGNIRANGKIIGDLAGRDISLIACAVQGNITASGLVTVDEESVVVGDIKGENFCLDGRIKGNVTVEKEAAFQPKAILAGNVTTASIAMSQGAKIQGEVNIPLSDKDTEMAFEIDMRI
jgi:cytoskeletal protein CcmA (bactofilin family)